MSKISVRLEDILPIGTITINACATDLSDFHDLSADFTPAFIVAARLKAAAVDAIMNPEMLISERVIITQRMDANLGLLLDPINKLQFYVDHAVGLTITADRFGISEVRDARNNGDLEKLDSKMRDLLANIAVTVNMDALVAKGYTVAKNASLIAMRTSFSTDKASQASKDKQIAQLRVDNAGVLDSFWDELSLIWSAGKSIYKVNNPTNVKFYTISYLKSKVRNDSLHGGFSGAVSFVADVKKGAYITIKPVLGGHLRKCMLDKDGNFDITSLAGSQYGYTVYDVNGVVLKAGTFSLDTAEKLVMDIAA